MLKKTVLKVDISCHKRKTMILKAVSGLQGVDKVEVDGDKGLLTVTGEADPYDIIVKARKVGKYAHVVSIGPPSKQDPQKKPEINKAYHCGPICEGNPIVYVTRSQEPSPQCIIL